jgi:hypothetical protein
MLQVQAPKGAKEGLLTSSSVPSGLERFAVVNPPLKTVGYFRASLRDGRRLSRPLDLSISSPRMKR